MKDSKLHRQTFSKRVSETDAQISFKSENPLSFDHKAYISEFHNLWYCHSPES